MKQFFRDKQKKQIKKRILKCTENYFLESKLTNIATKITT